MILIYDKQLNVIDELSQDQIIAAYEYQELSKNITANIKFDYKLYNDETRFFGYKSEDLFFLYKIINEKKESGFIEFEGIHIFFDDLKDDVIIDKRPSNMTVSQVMDIIFENTGWTVISDAIGTNSTNFYYISKLDAFKKVLELWQVEYDIQLKLTPSGFDKKVYIKNKISKDYGKWYEYTDKLITVIAENSRQDIYTALVGRGSALETEGGGFSRKINFSNVEWKKTKGDPVDKLIGVEYVENKELTSLYGYFNGKPRIGIIEFDDIKDPEELIKFTYDYLINTAGRPKVQLKATAIDSETIELGETVTIIRDDLDIRYKTRIFKINKNLLNNKIQSFEFGDKIVISQTQRRINAQKEQDRKFEEIESKLLQSLEQITNYYFNEDGYNYELKSGNKYGLPAGYYSFDKPIDQNPTKVVYMGAGKVLIADEKGSDGNWKWKTAIDGTGIAGGEILTHSITANKLASDVGQGLDLSSNEYIQNIVSNNSDISEEVYKKISELNNLLNDKISEDTINSLLEEINNQLNVNSTKINQNENRIEIEFESIKAEVDNNRADLNTLTSTITSGQDDDGNAYTEWGSTGNAKVRVGANGIDIISNDQETMTFKDGEAYAKALYVTETIGYGNHTAQKYGTEYTIFNGNGGTR